MIFYLYFCTKSIEKKSGGGGGRLSFRQVGSPTTLLFGSTLVFLDVQREGVVWHNLTSHSVYSIYPHAS